MNFDNFRREAERALGKDAADRIERELRQQDRGYDRREILKTGDIDFRRDSSGSEVGSSARASKDEPAKEEARPVANVDSTHSLVARPTPGSQTQESHAPSHSAILLGQAVKWEYIYGVSGLVLGLSSIVGGSILGLNGVAGSTSWTASLLGLESQINDAAPGVVLFVVGIFLVWITKPKVKFGNLKG